MRLERDQYWTYSFDNDRTIIIWIIEVDKENITLSWWDSLHKHVGAIKLSPPTIKEVLWDNDAQVIDHEKAICLLDIWKPYGPPDKK